MKFSDVIAIYLTNGGAIQFDYSDEAWNQLLDAVDSPNP